MNKQISSLFVFFILTAHILYGQNPYVSYQKLKEMEEHSIFRSLCWNSIGPTFQGSRVSSVDSPIDQPNIIYAGFGTGGLWKSQDQGLSWACVFTDQAASGIGDVTIAQSNPEIVYLGTGDALRSTRGYSYPGSGMYKTIDGGKSWVPIGLPDSHHIGRVVVDPNNPDLVFVAAIGHWWTPNEERGLFMTTDGGISWKKVLYLSDQVGVVDVVWDHVNRIIYAATWDMNQGKKSGVFKSEDFGKSWSPCTLGLTAQNGIGRIGLAMSQRHPNILYAAIDNRNVLSARSSSEIIGLEVFRSDDYGKSWTKTHSSQMNNYSGFGWSFGTIKVSPVNDNEIYILGVHPIYSKDGGKTFIQMSGIVSHLIPNPSPSLHLDNHDLYIDPVNPGRLILGNNGGVYLSFDSGLHWLHCNNIPVAEIVDFSLDEQRNIAYCGTRDQAAIFGQIKTDHPVESKIGWDYVWLDPWSGGDGFITIPDPSKPEEVYYEFQNGSLNRKNMVTGESTFIQPKPEEDEAPLRNNWLTPYFISVHSSTSIYFGGNKVYKSINRGESWYRLSPDLCYTEDLSKKSRTVTAINESPVKQGLLYAGTDKGAAWASRNDGVNWFEISEGLPNQYVVQLCPSRHIESRVYIVMRSNDEDDYKPYLFLSEKKGTTWKSISDGLPDDRVNCILEDPDLPDLIYIGTDRGIFVSPDKGNSWMSISFGLPTVSVQKLSWAKGGKYLIAATFGQGLFSCFAAPIRNYFKVVDPLSECLLGSETGYLPGTKDFPGDFNWSRSLPASIFWYQPKQGKMTITITNDQEKEISSGFIDAQAGINRWSWNLVISSKEDSGLYPITEYKFPAPGTYQFSVQGQGMVFKTNLEIR